MRRIHDKTPNLGVGSVFFIIFQKAWKHHRQGTFSIAPNSADLQKEYPVLRGFPGFLIPLFLTAALHRGSVSDITTEIVLMSIFTI